MRQLFTYPIFLSLLLLVFSCDDSFLDENKKTIEEYTLNTSLYINPTNEFTEVSATLPDLKNKDFKVIQFPTIMEFESLRGHIDNSGNLTFKIKVDNFDSHIDIEPQFIGFIIIDVEDFGFLSIKVEHLNMGRPELKLSRTEIDYDIIRTPESLIISNENEGYLIFAVTDFPSWINVTTLSGDNAKNNLITLHPYGQYELMVTCNDENLTPGNYEGDIVIESNDVHSQRHVLKVKMRVRERKNSDNISDITGNVVSSTFDKNSNRLFIATSNPNRIITYNMDDLSKQEYPIEKNISVIRLTEKGDSLLVGQSTRLNILDTQNFTNLKTVELDFVVNDIVSGDNGYYYLTNSDREIYSYNIETNKLINHTAGVYVNRFEGECLLKVKNKPYLITTNRAMYSVGMHLLDISLGIPAYYKYWHMNIGGIIWEDYSNNTILSQKGDLYTTPSENSGVNIYEIGQILPDYSTLPDETPGYKQYYWLDINYDTGSIWGVFDPADFHYKFNQSQIIEWNLANYHIKRTIPFSDFYTTIDGITDFYKTLPKYIFSNKNGDTIFLIKNVIVLRNDQTHELGNWHLEIIDVSK